MSSDRTERRTHPRNRYEEYLKICLHSRPQHDTLVVVSSDLSDSGLCIYTSNPLEEGEELIFLSNLPIPYQKGTVKWVKQYNRSVYRIGVLFSEDYDPILACDQSQKNCTQRVLSLMLRKDHDRI